MHLNGMGAPRSSPLKRSASWSRLPLNFRRCHPNRRSCRHLSSQNEKAMARKCETRVPIAHTPRHGGVDRAPGATHAGVDRAPPATRRCRSRTRRVTRGCRSRTPPCTRPSHGQIWQPTAATSLPPPPFWHQVPMAAPCTCSLSSTYGFPAVRSSSSLLRQGFRSLSSVLFACITRCAVTCADGDVAELCGDLFYASTMDACIA